MNHRVYTLADVRRKTWDGVANALASRWAKAIREAPEDFERGTAFLWYAQLEDGGLTLYSATDPEWSPLGREFLVSIGLIEREYSSIEELTGPSFERGYDALAKRTVACLRKARKILINRPWPRNLNWVKTKTCCFVDDAEVISLDVITWIGGQRLRRELAAPPVERILRFCRKFDLVPEWMFLGSGKKLKVVAIYQAANNPRVLKALHELLGGLPKSFLPKKLVIDQGLVVAQRALKLIESTLGCRAEELKGDLFDFVETYEQTEWIKTDAY